jgi:hypothetical protein
MGIIYTTVSHLNTVEKYYVYGETLNKNRLNDQNTTEQNDIFYNLFHVDH